MTKAEYLHFFDKVYFLNLVIFCLEIILILCYYIKIRVEILKIINKLGGPFY